jgi:uncharacterized protein (UPF0548 family)
LVGFFHLREPHAHAGALALGTAPFSYQDVGATRDEPPAGWNVDRLEEPIGRGEGDFERAKDAVRSWTMFQMPWLRLLTPSDLPIEPGVGVVFASWQVGVWVVNNCRVVYVVDEETETEARFGFAYGTLGQHAVAGEERFLARWDKRTDEVSFEIYKFSRLRHPLVRLVAPLARHIQQRFSKGAIDAVRQAVSA